MKQTYKILIFIVIIFTLLSSACKTQKQQKVTDYRHVINKYLASKIIEPTNVYDNYDQNEFNISGHNISWRQLHKGIEITIDKNTISTNNKVTTNPVWGKGCDSVHFANFLQQVKVYNNNSLIGFVLTNSPCSGLGCSVNYQLIYNIKTKSESYFGRFKTGSELELYDFNNDNKPDYLSKTFYGRNGLKADTIKFVMYSHSPNGSFKKYRTEKSKEFWFKHIYTEYDAEIKKQYFEEKWIERINVYF